MPFAKIFVQLNVTARVEFELTYSEAAVQHFSHYVMRTPPSFVKERQTQTDIILFGKS